MKRNMIDHQRDQRDQRDNDALMMNYHVRSMPSAPPRFFFSNQLQRCLPDDKQAVQEIAQELRNGVVTTLDLSYNNLDAEAGKALAAALEGNGVLTSLNLGGNYLDAEAGKALADALSVNSVLTCGDGHRGEPVYVPSKSLEELQADARAGAMALAEFKRQKAALQRICVHCRRPHSEHRREEFKSVLTKLDVGYNNMNEEAALAIVRAVRPRDIMTSLGLASCKIGPTGAKEIAEYVKGSSVLTSLDLSYNLSTEAGKALADSLSVNGFLTKLDVSYNFMDEEAALAIVRAVRPRDIMTSLGLAACKIGLDGAKEIAEYVKGSGVLTKLDVGYNNMNEEAALAIVRAVRPRDIMTSLGLARCKIGPDGAKEIAEYVKVSGVLTNLDLNYNKIGGEEARQLAEAALGSASLEVLSQVPIKELREDKHTALDLSNLGLGLTESIVLAEVLKVSGVLTFLNLCDNRLDAEAGKALASALAVNGVMKTLDIRYNDLGDAEQALQAAVKGREGFELLV